MPKVNRFTQRTPTYTCIICQKLTRETGDGESSVEMCADCYEWESQQNYHSDEGHTGEMSACPECMAQIYRSANKAKSTAPVWILCPDDCGEFFCTVHNKHAHDCDCPPLN